MTYTKQFYHSTVIPETTINRCICTKGNDKELELFFTYNNIAQRIVLNLENEEMEAKEIERFYTGTTIIWSAFQDNMIGTLDTKNNFTRYFLHYFCSLNR